MWNVNFSLCSNRQNRNRTKTPIAAKWLRKVALVPSLSLQSLSLALRKVSPAARVRKLYPTAALFFFPPIRMPYLNISSRRLWNPKTLNNRRRLSQKTEHFSTLFPRLSFSWLHTHKNCNLHLFLFFFFLGAIVLISLNYTCNNNRSRTWHIVRNPHFVLFFIFCSSSARLYFNVHLSGRLSKPFLKFSLCNPLLNVCPHTVFTLSFRKFTFIYNLS